MKEFKGTRGIWSLDKNGDVSGDNHPVCTVTSGQWGDTYPTLKLEGLSLKRTCVPVMDMIVYGEISEEESNANANLISAAPELLEALESFINSCYAGCTKEELDLVRIKGEKAVKKALGE